MKKFLNKVAVGIFLIAILVSCGIPERKKLPDINNLQEWEGVMDDATPVSLS